MSEPASGMMPGTAERIARERVEAARALLARPMLTSTDHGDELALVRRHFPALRTVFMTDLGYPLLVESTFARLAKGPVSSAAAPRPARRGGDGARAFTPTTYTYLSLLCAALLSPHTGEQILISALIEQVRADAVTAELTVGDSLEHRRELVTALTQLVAWGVLEETEGRAAAWGERRDEVLLTIHRPVLTQLLSRRLADLDHPWQVLEPGESAEPRKSLRRKLVEDPLVRREDLTEAERDVLSRERTELARVLEEHFGLTLEVRAEGALAYDAQSLTGLSDIAFPGRGTVPWATLLLCGALCDRLEPEASATVTLPDGGVVPGAAASLTVVDDVMADLAERYGRAWGAAYVANLPRLREEVLAFAEQFSLIRRITFSTTATAPVTDVDDGDVDGHDSVGSVGGIVLHPVAARYRPQARTAAPTRAQQRAAAVQQDLFTDVVGDLSDDGHSIDEDSS